MLTFRRAVVFAVVVLSLFFLLHSHHSSRHYNSADQLPKPKSVEAWVHKSIQGSDKTRTTREAEAEADADAALSALSLPPSAPIDHILQQNTRTRISPQDLRHRPLRQQLAYQFPYDHLAKFPAYIWQTWKVNPSSEKFNSNFRAPEASWTELHPGFVHEIITDDMAPHLMKHLYATMPEVLEAYNALPAPVLQADFFRYLILFARGGIYSDIDTSALRSATEWVPSSVPRSSYGMVIGIEADPDREDWADWYSRRIQFCQWTIQSKPGHPILLDIITNITQETLTRKAAGTLSKDHKRFIEYTGPAIWTDTIFNFFNNPEYFDMSNGDANITWRNFTGMKTPRKVGDVIVLPITSFSPGVQQMGAGEATDPMAFVKHHFEGSWKPENERHIGNTLTL